MEEVSILGGSKCTVVGQGESWWERGGAWRREGWVGKGRGDAGDKMVCVALCVCV